MQPLPAPSRTPGERARQRALFAAIRARLAADRTDPDAPRIPTGQPELDRLLGGGLPAHALHEIAPQPAAHAHAPAAAFAARLAAAAGGETLWAARLLDIFPPGLAGAGLPPGRLLLARTGSDRETLAAMEEAMGAVAAVVGEIARPGPWLVAASRRLQLRARRTGTLALLLHRAPAPARIPTLAETCWQVGPAPSPPAQVRALFPGPGGAGLGPRHLAVTLARARGAAAMRLPLTLSLLFEPDPPERHAPDRLPLVPALAGGAAGPGPRARLGTAAS
jgi:protein ImuA